MLIDDILIRIAKGLESANENASLARKKHERLEVEKMITQTTIALAACNPADFAERILQKRLQYLEDLL